jgi:hypothetical protein
MFVILTTPTYSIAPADVFATVEVIPTCLCFEIIIPLTPVASAVLIIAPKLCGSLISESIKINLG